MVAVTDEALLAEAVRRLVEALQPERIYLFGSRARGDAHADSDYDLLVVVPEAHDSTLHLSQRAYGSLHGVQLPVDVLVMTRTEFEEWIPAVASLSATV